jgi:hypothetical protein
MTPAEYAAMHAAAGALGIALGVTALWAFYARLWRHEFSEPMPRDMHLFYARIVVGLAAFAALAAWLTL